MKIYLCALSFATSFSVMAQTVSAPVYYSDETLSELSRLQQAALSSDYAYKNAAFLTNNIGPRLSGSPQAQRAVEYVAEEMRKAGLEVQLQKVMVPHWVRGVETGEIVEFPGMAKGSVQKIALAALGRSIATPEQGLTAELVVVKSFEELQRLGKEKIAGKIVLFNNKFDVDMQASGFGGAAYSQAVKFRGRGAVEASRFGAVAALIRSAGGSQNRLVHTGAMSYDAAVPKIPAAAVAYEDAETLAYLAKMGRTRVHITLTPQTFPDAVSYNVIGDIKGSQKPAEIVLVGGHLDSWDLGTGALDNASGVAASMQVGYLIRKLKMKPKRTIRVVAFMNEENGAMGGREYFEQNKTKLQDHFAVIESDFGASHPLGFYYAGKKEALPFLVPISKVLLSQGAHQIDFTRDEVGVDTSLLTQAKVPSLAPKLDARTYFNYHHTAADTFDKINPKELAELGSVLAVLTYGLANLEQPLPR